MNQGVSQPGPDFYTCRICKTEYEPKEQGPHATNWCFRCERSTGPGSEAWRAAQAHAPQAQEEPSGAPAPAAPEVIRLSRKEFEALLEYSASLPTGTTIGKRWRKKNAGGWWIGEYVPDPDPKMVGIKWYKAEITDEPPAPASPAAPPIKLRIIPGESTPQDTANLLEALAQLYRAYGGTGIEFSITPAAPEAGAPGTQGATLCECPCGCKRPADSLVIVGGKPAYRECDWCDNCQHAEDKSVHRPPTQAQEGGSQP